jgi:pyruvate formate lyase activating enzyme
MSSLFYLEDDSRIRCVSCGHRCLIAEGASGICGVRQNVSGDLLVPRNFVAAKKIMPVEINTVYHVRPGKKSLIFGMFGCDMHCGYCQNWKISQAPRESRSMEPEPVTPQSLIEEAIAEGCEVICSAFNEPLITSEWANEVFAEAKRRKLVTMFVSDGNATPEVLRYLRPHLDVYRIDLKAGTEENYHQLGGRLSVVLQSMREAYELGFWVEAVSLLVPYFNDHPSEIRFMAAAVAQISPDIPWHVNAFLPNYKMTERPPTSFQILNLAAGIGYGKGLKYVYIGNLAGSPLENTYCPECKNVLIERTNYSVTNCAVMNGSCPQCGYRIPGIW